MRRELRSYDHATDRPPQVDEGPAYTIIHEAEDFALYCLDQMSPEQTMETLLWWFGSAFDFYLDGQMARTFAGWREVFTPRVVSLN